MSGGVAHVGQCATHRVYHLTCEDFCALVAAYDGRCAICRITGDKTRHGILFIDHDYRHGYWAVRGLLCSPCNSRIDAFGHTRTAGEEAYLADPWFRRRFAELGRNVDPQPEPAIGAVVIGRARRRWWRTNEGWVRCGHYRALSWAELNRSLGPHNIRVAA